MLDNELKKVNIAQKSLINLSNEERKKCLINIKDSIIENTTLIINENLKDIDNARKANLKESLIERLTLDEKRIALLYALLEEMEKQGRDAEASALRWAIFQLEQN